MSQLARQLKRQLEKKSSLEKLLTRRYSLNQINEALNDLEQRIYMNTPAETLINSFTRTM